MWGTLSARIQHINSPGGILEFPTGWPLQTICVFLASGWYCLTALQRLRAHNNRNDSDNARSCLMAAIALTCVALWPVGIRIGQHAPAWAVLLHLVPGAGAIRLPQRIDLVLNLGVVVVCMFGFEKLMQSLSGRGAWVYFLPVVMGGVLLAEQRNVMPTHLISRSEEVRRFDRISAPPRECSYFYTSSWADDHIGKVVLQTDGMMVAQIYSIPTLDGTSSWFPPGWDLLDAPKGHVKQDAFTWASTHGLSKGLCSLDINSGQWTAQDLSHFDPSAKLAETIDNKLSDPGFEEEDLAFWQPFQSVHATVSTADPHSGARSLAETESDGSVYQDAKGLEPGRKYQVTAWVSSSPDATAGAQIATWDSSTNGPAVSKEVQPRGTWQLLSAVASADPSGSLRIHLFRLKGSGTIYWDDVRIDPDQATRQTTPDK